MLNTLVVTTQCVYYTPAHLPFERILVLVCVDDSGGLQLNVVL